MSDDETQDTIDALAGRVAEAVQSSGRTVAAAESVSGGHLASALAAAGGASEWFLGSVVAYSAEVKYTVLGVERGPVITERCAEQMAAGAAKLLGADFTVATTGAGGPGEEEGRPAGTVYVAVAAPTGCRVREYHFDGDPPAVVLRATEAALQALLEACEQVGT